MRHTQGARIGQAIHIRPAHQHGLCTQRHGFQHIGAATDAAVHQQGQVSRHSVCNAGQHRRGGRGGVQRAASVVGHDDTAQLQGHGLARVVCVQHTFDEHGQAGDGLQPFHVGPGWGVGQ